MIGKFTIICKCKCPGFLFSFILDYATEVGGIVVSGDNYKDLYQENRKWRETIANRILMPTWADKKTLMFPEDPLGRKGPSLDRFLKFV